MDTDKEWAEAAASGDVDRIVTFWTDDAIIYFPNADIVSGKEEIQRFVTNNRNQPGFALTWTPTEAVVSTAGDLGYTAGTGQLSVNDDNGNLITRKANYICIWEKQADGSWSAPGKFPISVPFLNYSDWGWEIITAVLSHKLHRLSLIL